MRTLVLFLITTLLLACATPPKQEPTLVEDRIIVHTPLREKINSIIQDAKAEIGIALIGPEGDTLSIHGDDSFPLMSVAKFPQALTLLHFVDLGKIERNKKIPITDHDFTQKTASSLRKDHPENDVQLSIPEVLAYSLGQSDNITSNVIFDQVGGPTVVDEYISKLGVSGINIGTDYWHLSEDITKNNGTPKAMVLLLQKFYNDSILSEESKKTIWKAMIEATSGKNRIRGLLPAGTLVGHKTGTGNRNETSEISDAFNDAGIILLDNDTHFCLAVFIKNSSESDDTNASIMAQITRSIWDFYQR